MGKCFVLDTNVLLHDPNSLSSFGNNRVVIPIYAVEEIDNFKREQNELGRNARLTSRILDELRNRGDLMAGVPYEKGIVQIKLAHSKLPEHLVAVDRGADSKILAVAIEVAAEEETVFVTKDINLRIRASAMGLKAEDYITECGDLSELYTGVVEIEVDEETIDNLFAKKKVGLPKAELEENSFGVLTSGKKSALVRFDASKETTKLVRGASAWGIHSRNKEQQFALELLLDDSIKLVTLVGQAGTGKTLLAIAAGLEKVAEEKDFQKLLVSRPVFPLGRDIGYLPGDMNEKLRPWMQPIHDNLELLMGLSTDDKRKGRSGDELFNMGMIQVEPLTYIRGRSIPNQFIVVDEAQNLTPHEVKTIITRCGEGTKIVLTGDPNQIDNPYIDSTNNGLIHVVNRFRGQKMFGHVTLCKGERSDLAEVAARLL